VRTAAILPVKSFALAKQRLSASVEDSLRLALAGAMVGDVLAALAATEAIAATYVVTREPQAAEAALASGAIVIEDGSESGQSEAVALGVRRALADGFQRVLCVPGDCPALDHAELAALLSGHGLRGAEVVVLPDRHGTGTNGLLLTPPGAIEPSFGPGSCERHVSLAAAAGIPCRVEPIPSLMLDVDTGDDLAALREALSQLDRRAPRTRAALGEPAPRPEGHKRAAPLAGHS
jgi:2-phospho-L-lactate guanylyltransferase